MRRITSKQVNVRFVWCSSPITIDKRDEWGNAADNLQIAPNGAFLKMKGNTEVTHLVQPNADKTAPVGWIPGSEPGLFDKSPIYIGEYIQAGDKITLRTLDGRVTYTATELSVVCANEKDGCPDLNDQWVQKISDVEKNYFIGVR